MDGWLRNRQTAPQTTSDPPARRSTRSRHDHVWHIKLREARKPPLGRLSVSENGGPKKPRLRQHLLAGFPFHASPDSGGETASRQFPQHPNTPVGQQLVLRFSTLARSDFLGHDVHYWSPKYASTAIFDNSHYCDESNKTRSKRSNHGAQRLTSVRRRPHHASAAPRVVNTPP